MLADMQQIERAIDSFPLNMGVTGAEWLNDPANTALVFPNGDIALFEESDGSIYEGHLLFESRGAKAIENARKAAKHMFECCRAKALYGLVPNDRRDVKFVLRRIGFHSVGLRQTEHGLCEHFCMSYNDLN